MEKKFVTLGYVFRVVAAFCDKNALKFSEGSGHPAKLSFAQLLMISIFWQLCHIKDFKTFYCGPTRALLEEYFHNLPHYSNVLKRLPKLGEILLQVLRSGKSRGKFIIDSTAFRLCLRVRRLRYKSIREAMGKAVGSTKIIYGFKANLLTNWKGDRIENIAFSKGSIHDGHSPWRACRLLTQLFGAEC